MASNNASSNMKEKVQNKKSEMIQICASAPNRFEKEKCKGAIYALEWVINNVLDTEESKRTQ